MVEPILHLWREAGYAGANQDEEMAMDDLFEIMQTTRSMRRLKPDPYPTN